MFKMISTLIKREYWENYQLLCRLPLWVCVIVSVFILSISALSYSHYLHHMSGNMHFMTYNNPALHLIKSASILVPLFSVFLWITLFTYALRTLFVDRKDGSIFFWHSMPTPQNTIIISKLFTLFIIAPICSWIFLTITTWVCYIGIFIGHYGFNYHSFSVSTFLLQAINNTFYNLFHLWMVGLWLAPILSLCFVSSAYSKRSPAVAVFVFLFVASILDLLFTKTHRIALFIIHSFSYSLNGGAVTIANHHFFVNTSNLMIRFSIGLGIAIVLFIIAGCIRSKNLDFRND